VAARDAATSAGGTPALLNPYQTSLSSYASSSSLN
jgi:hypothetical protein